MGCISLFAGHSFENKCQSTLDKRGNDAGGWQVTFVGRKFEKKSGGFGNTIFPWYHSPGSCDPDEKNYPVYACQCRRCKKNYFIPLTNKNAIKYNLPWDAIINNRVISMGEICELEIPLIVGPKAFEKLYPESKKEFLDRYHLQPQGDGSYIGSFKEKIALCGSNVFKYKYSDSIIQKPFIEGKEDYEIGDQELLGELSDSSINYQIILFRDDPIGQDWFPGYKGKWVVTNIRGKRNDAYVAHLLSIDGVLQICHPVMEKVDGLTLKFYITDSITEKERQEKERQAHIDFRWREEQREKDEERKKLAKAIADEFRKG